MLVAACECVTAGPPLETTVEAAETEESIYNLFQAAVACGDRNKCPPQDKLFERAARPDGQSVAKVAFDLMCNPAVGDREGGLANRIVAAWINNRQKAGTFDAAAQRFVVDQAKRVMSGEMWLPPGVTKMTIDGMQQTANSGRHRSAIIGLLVDYNLPGAEKVIVDEIESGKSLDNLYGQVELLAHFQKDLPHAKQWLDRKDERSLLVGLTLIGLIDHRKINQVDEELPLLRSVAARIDLPRNAALKLVEHVALHEDSAFDPVLRALERHGDADVRRAAADALKAVAAAEASRSTKH